MEARACHRIFPLFAAQAHERLACADPVATPGRHGCFAGETSLDRDFRHDFDELSGALSMAREVYVEDHKRCPC